MTPLEINVPGGNPLRPGFSLKRGPNGLSIGAGQLSDSPVGFGMTNDEGGLGISVYSLPALRLEVLVVAGGGGASSGGGGGGGVVHVTSNSAPAPGTYVVHVGLGGAGGDSMYYLVADSVDGEDSRLGDWYAYGGGRGNRTNNPGSDGGSGGGGGLMNPGYDGWGGDAVYGSLGNMGNDGGDGGYWSGSVPYEFGGGGGGASVAGATGSSGGEGGQGYSTDIIERGSPVVYGSGGGGGLWRTPDDVPVSQGGASGGDGAGTGGGGYANGDAGLANRGGGGGGSGRGAYDLEHGVGGAGGSGIVVCRYQTGLMQATGGTITQDGSFTVHVWTSDGSLVVS